MGPQIMTIIFLLIPLSVVLATGFLVAFIWAVRSGQYEDTCTPSMRMLLHDGIIQSRAEAAGRSSNESAATVCLPLDQRRESVCPQNLNRAAEATLPANVLTADEPICLTPTKS